MLIHDTHIVDSQREYYGIIALERIITNEIIVEAIIVTAASRQLLLRHVDRARDGYL